MSPNIRVERKSGVDLQSFIPELARLRIEVFREFPYLYDGDLGYEEKYLQTYINCPESVIVLAFDGDKIIGASTAIPLKYETEEVKRPFVELGYNPDEIFYCGESVLNKQYRGFGLGVKFFEQREAHAADLGGFKHICFCCVERPVDHPRRPADYVPLDKFWNKRGYFKHPELKTTYTWKDLDDTHETPKPMTFWLNMTIKIAAAQYDIRFFSDWAAYVTKIERWVEEAVAAKANILVFPEYASMELASLFGEAVYSSLSAQLHAMQSLHADFVALYQGLAQQHQCLIQPGTFPLQQPGGEYRNRAYLFMPDGRYDYQDKLQMTRFENEQWLIKSGSELKVFETDFGKIAINICYDSEFPLLARKQVEAGADLILVPSCTDTLAGYYRVRIGCQARALENQCYVVQASVVGNAPWSEAVDVNIGAAAIYTPVDRGFPDNGILAIGELNVAQWVYAELSLSDIATVRRQGQVFNYRDWPLQGRFV